MSVYICACVCVCVHVFVGIYVYIYVYTYIHINPATLLASTQLEKKKNKPFLLSVITLFLRIERLGDHTWPNLIFQLLPTFFF